jgi:nucleotide-binding universal stress UspA family protein
VAAGIRERGIKVKIVVTEKAPNVAITQYAETNQVDVIALRSRGHSGPGRWLTSSVADRVVRGASAMVLLVRPKQRHRRERMPGVTNG